LHSPNNNAISESSHSNGFVKRVDLNYSMLIGAAARSNLVSLEPALCRCKQIMRQGTELVDELGVVAPEIYFVLKSPQS